MAVPNIVALVKACCVLHNFTRAIEGGAADSQEDRSEGPDETGGNLQSMRDVNGQARGRLNCAGKNVRNTFADYFVSEEGAVPWQDDSAARGEIFPETLYTILQGCTIKSRLIQSWFSNIDFFAHIKSNCI
jgi:hypothetical protein